MSSRIPILPSLASLLLASGCAPMTDADIIHLGDELDATHETTDPADSADSSALAITTPVKLRSGAWWGDVSTPLDNQLWGEVLNATPGKTLHSPYTYRWTCNLPRFTGSRQTLKLRSAQLHINSNMVFHTTHVSPGAEVRYTVDPSRYPSGWVEIRIRCSAEETQGAETGERTAITAGFPVNFRGGSNVNAHNGTNYMDTHGWYSREVGYTYAVIRNISEVLGGPLKGVVALQLRASKLSEKTVVDHFMVKIDDQLATMTDGRKAEFSGSTRDRTIYIDTRKLSNGPHVLAMHSHTLETSGANAGKQLAAQVEVTLNVQN